MIMSHYYVARRIQPIQPTQDNAPTNDSPHHPLDESIYVFPIPSSSPPSPQLSDVSAPTDFTLSGISNPSVGNESSLSLVHSPLTPLSPLGGIGLNEISLGTRTYDGVEQFDQWRHILIRRRAGKSLTDYPQAPNVVSTKDITLVNSDDPDLHSHLQIPLLSFFTSLLSVEDTTVHLLYHSSSQSVLFPGQNLLSESQLVKDTHDLDLHGVEKLLMRTSETQVFKDGFTVASDDPDPSFIPFSPLGFWGIVSEFVANGSQALLQAFQPR